MRFKTDENLHPDAATRLRQHGFDALSIWDQKLRGVDDARIAEVCRSARRAIATCDLGFADIRLYPPEDFAGLIVIRMMSQSRDSVMAAIERIITLLRTRSIEGQLWIVDEHSVRIRASDATFES